MKEIEIDIPLSEDEKKEKIEFLKNNKFEDFKIHRYYSEDSYYRHPVEIEIIKEIYPQFDKIIDVWKRPAKNGFKYSFSYKIKENEYLVLCFFLDETPPYFFDAYFDYSNREKNLKRKIGK